MVGRAEGFGSNWQSNNQGLGQAAADVKARINAYDQAAPSPFKLAKPMDQDTFTQQWYDCTTHRFIRDLGSAALDKHVPLPDNLARGLSSLSEKANPFAQTAVSYTRIFKVTPHLIETGSTQAYKSAIHCILSQEGRQKLANNVYANILSFNRPSIKPLEYLKHTVAAGNVATITKPWRRDSFSQVSLELDGLL